MALRLLQVQGRRDITAFYLKIWLEEELAFLGDCPWEEDLACARGVCEQAGVPLEIVALQGEYQERVVAHVVRELKAGRTPSPDILCNEWIKFGLFFDKIDPGFERVASGHYAQIERQGDVVLLKRSPDPVKDQSYFLSRLTQAQLRRIEFPVGHLHKPEVRRLAEEFGLPNRARRDSQGICFLGKIKYPDFVRFHLGEQEGDIVEIDSGKKLGLHQGVWFHTVGQRKGLGLSGGPWYVVAKDLARNIVFVAHADRYLEHARDELTIAEAHWIAGHAPEKRALLCKLRHGPRLQGCEIASLGSNRWHLRLAEKDAGIAAGQSAILYDGEYCLGGGVIEDISSAAPLSAIAPTT